MRCRPGTSSIRSSIALHDKIDLEVATVFGAAHRLNSIQTLLGEENAVETKTMGKVVVTAKIENLKDLFEVERGSLNNDQVRRIEVHDAIVDTGATTLLLPQRMVAALGLSPLRVRHSRGLGGDFLLPVFGTVRLTIQGRDCPLDVGQISDEYPVLIGQIPLEALDWVVDTKGQRLIGNPDHGGEWGMDAY
jgi:predicted aspartyl protease